MPHAGSEVLKSDDVFAGVRSAVSLVPAVSGADALTSKELSRRLTAVGQLGGLEMSNSSRRLFRFAKQTGKARDEIRVFRIP